VSEKRCATKEKFSAVASSKLWVFWTNRGRACHRHCTRCNAGARCSRSGRSPHPAFIHLVPLPCPFFPRATL
jgi:hypothetical protein